MRWSKLPDAYRQRVKPTCEHYGIFSKNKRHGGNELDISAMITYTTSDKWLRTNGRLAFVIRGEIFKNPSSAGFRHFRLVPNNPKTLHLKPVSVDDMKALKPFEDATNHTVVAVFDKVKKAGTYPVPYKLWDSVPGQSKAIPAGLTLPEVMTRITITSNEAAPVDELGSPWAVLAQGRHQALHALSGECTWVAGRKGVTTDLNGVYFVPIIKSNGTLVQVCSRPDSGKKDIGPAKTAWVEPALLYPLIKGAGDFEACYIRLSNPKPIAENLYTFVPNHGIGDDDYEAAEVVMNSTNLAKTRAWFARQKTLLKDRSTYRRQMPGAPFYAIYNVGNYSFKPWKVVWPEMSNRFYAAVAGSAVVPVVGTRPYVPDHKIYFAAFDEKEPAYFLCGLLNTPTVREWVESHNVSIQVGNIFKHMQVPTFDSTNADHLDLATIVEKAHKEHDATKRAALVRKVESDGEKILKAWMRRNAKIRRKMATAT